MNEQRVEIDADQAIAGAVARNDFQYLSDEQRAAYYQQVCASVGLSPLTAPFSFMWAYRKDRQGIVTEKRLSLYAKRDATDQLRRLHNVSIKITARWVEGDVYCVTALATMPDGRTDESLGAVSIAGVGGSYLANALMAAETKAKRRVTLSICGLGLLDETEVESVTDGSLVPADSTPPAQTGPASLPAAPEVKAAATPRSQPKQVAATTAAAAPAQTATAPRRSSQPAAKIAPERLGAWTAWLASPGIPLAKFIEVRPQFVAEFGGEFMAVEHQRLWRGAIARRVVEILRDDPGEVERVEADARNLFGSRCPAEAAAAIAEARERCRAAAPEEVYDRPHDNEDVEFPVEQADMQEPTRGRVLSMPPLPKAAPQVARRSR